MAVPTYKSKGIITTEAPAVEMDPKTVGEFGL